tara:strand:- start:305 stop:463 length:159 start_codon:yes stop_codon:yes gene_type:complete
MNTLRQIAAQKPKIFPPIKTTLLGNKRAGKKIILIIMIPVKKKNLNIKSLIM